MLLQGKYTVVTGASRGIGRDIAGAVVYLASSLADYVTGATIDVNGGLYLR